MFEVHLLESPELHGGKRDDPLKHVIWSSDEFDYWQDNPAGVSFWIGGFSDDQYRLMSRTPQHHVHKVWVTHKPDPTPPEPVRHEPSYDHLAVPYADDNVMPVPTYAAAGESLTHEFDLTRLEHAQFVKNNDPTDISVVRVEEERETFIEYVDRISGAPIIETRTHLKSLEVRESPLAHKYTSHPGAGAAAEIVFPLSDTVKPGTDGLPRRDTRNEDTHLILPPFLPSQEGSEGS